MELLGQHLETIQRGGVVGEVGFTVEELVVEITGAAEPDIAVQAAAVDSDQHVAAFLVVDTLRQERHGAQKVRVSSLVVKSDRHFDLADADTCPVVKAVIAEPPVKADFVIPFLSQIAGEQLGADAEIIIDIHGKSQADLV